jgi:hypothetical protein
MSGTSVSLDASISQNNHLNAQHTKIEEENQYLQKEIDSLINSTNTSSRMNTYFAEDKMLSIYVNRMMIIIYIGIYFALLYSLFLNRQSTSTLSIVVIAVVFLLLPYAIDIIAKYMYNKFISAMHILYKGNALYMYKPVDKVDTL